MNRLFVIAILLLAPFASASTWTTTVNALAPFCGYRLDETSGTVAADTQTANPGTIVNSPTLGVTSLVPNDPDKAMQFAAASSQYVTIGGTAVNTAFDDAVHASILFACKWTANSDTIYVGFSRGGGARFLLEKNGDATMLALVEGGSAAGMQLNVNPSIGTHLFLLTFDGSQGTASNRVKIYMDGVSQAWTTVAAAPPTTLNHDVGTFEIGRSLSAGAYSNGVIDEVYLFNKTLTSTDATNLYTAYSTTTPAAPTLNSVAVTATTAQFNFTPNDGGTATSYTLRWSIDPSMSGAGTQTVASGVTTGTATGLTANTTYYFDMLANNANGSSSPSNQISKTTPALGAGNNHMGLDIGIGISSALFPSNVPYANSDVIGRIGFRTTSRSARYFDPAVTN